MTSARRKSVKRKKPFYRSRLFWFSLLASFLFLGISYLLFFSSVFQIEEIEITGNEKVKSERIEERIVPFLGHVFQVDPFFEGVGPWRIFDTRSILLLAGKKIEKEVIEVFPRVGRVRVKRHFPDKVVLEIEERVPFAEICERSGRCFVVDESSVAFEESASVKEEKGEGVKVLEVEKEELTVKLEEEKSVNLGEGAMKPSYLQVIRKIKTGVEEDTGFKVKDIYYSGERVNVETERGVKLYFNLERSAEDQLLNLSLVLKEKISAEELMELEYIDLRFGNRVYYK